MSQEDIGYFSARVLQEERLAAAASSAKVRTTHLNFAAAYRQRLARAGGTGAAAGAAAPRGVKPGTPA